MLRATGKIAQVDLAGDYFRLLLNINPLIFKTRKIEQTMIINSCGSVSPKNTLEYSRWELRVKLFFYIAGTRTPFFHCSHPLMILPSTNGLQCYFFAFPPCNIIWMTRSVVSNAEYTGRLLLAS